MVTSCGPDRANSSLQSEKLSTKKEETDCRKKRRLNFRKVWLLLGETPMMSATLSECYDIKDQI